MICLLWIELKEEEDMERYVYVFGSFLYVSGYVWEVYEVLSKV